MQLFKAPRAFLMVIMLLVATAAIPITLYGLGVITLTTASVISNFGIPFVLLGALAYVIFYDSRKRWPGVPLMNRLGRLLLF